MSLNFTQIIAKIDREAGTSINSYPLADKVVDVNSVLSAFLFRAISASGTWQIDYTNHEYFPIIYTNLVLGRRDYTFLTDEEGIMILDIHKVMRANADGIYEEISPVDQQNINVDGRVAQMTDERDVQGVPECYDKTGNTIFLDPVPSYNYTEGLKVFISREGSEFTVSDTTKKPGVPGLFHDYFWMVPAYERLSSKAKTNAQIAKADRLLARITKMEANIDKHFRSRERDKRNVITGRRQNYI